MRDGKRQALPRIRRMQRISLLMLVVCGNSDGRGTSQFWLPLGQHYGNGVFDLVYHFEVSIIKVLVDCL